MIRQSSQRPLIAAAMTMGIGLGGFLDGILFHQIFQLHNMLSAKLPPTSVVNLEINMVWDGIFHGFCWIACAVGLGLLWWVIRRPDIPLVTQTFIGSLIAGWGLFNLVEGILNHHILHLHHVAETDNHLIWDLAFLGSGILFVAVGWGLIYQGHRPQRRAMEMATST